MSSKSIQIWLILVLIAPIDQTIIKPAEKSENKTIHTKIIHDAQNSIAYLNFNNQTKNESDIRTSIRNSNNLLTDKVKESYFNHEDALEGIKEEIKKFPKRISKKFELKIEARDINNAVDYGFKALEELVSIKEPLLYKLGLFLNENDPAARLANFGAPTNPKAILFSRFGFATLEASKKIAEIYNKDVYRQSSEFPFDLQAKADLDDCPLHGKPRCLSAFRRFRTADGTCNNLEHPWRGSAMLPMQRFLPPVYQDGIQSIRRSVTGSPLPSARKISFVFHKEKNQEIHSVTLMFMQWGQFIDHDVTSTARARGFNGSIPRCCDDGGRSMVPQQFLHPSCLPIEIPRNDPFLSKFGIGCMEFLRSAPSTRIDCELGWREQINQVTSYLDASMIYGSDIETSDSIRSFRNGQIFYGRPSGQGPLEPPDPPGGEICTEGAMSEECIQSGDGRFSENPSLVVMHTVFVRYHNKIANVLAQINRHWSDERVFQETRRIVYAAIQHITYKEYLPVVLGPEVMDLFELRLLKAGYYDGYDSKIFPAIANAFSTAAFRFGHSMVQNSFVRTDSHHIPLPNNVSLHNENFNFESIWSSGSLDRFILGLTNQYSQKRDEFIAEELTNHLFQFAGHFGMDLAAINIQRGRDHGIAPYTFWRKPCGLTPINNWQDLEQVMSLFSVIKLRSLYSHIDDIDLFTAGLAEKPLRGAVVGPTFACIIAQQFSNLRKGDRFWYENKGFESSLSPAQLQQIRKISLAQILCQTTREIETIQPFVFLSADSLRNRRVNCKSPEIRNFDLGVWTEKSFEFNSISDGVDLFESERSQKDLKIVKRDINKQSDYNTIPKKPTFSVQSTTTKRIKNKPNYYQINHKDATYLVGLVPERITKAPLNTNVHVNINIHYAPRSTTSTVPTINKRKYSKRPNNVTFSPTLTSLYNPIQNEEVVISKRPISSTTRRPTLSYPIFVYDKPTTKRPAYFFDNLQYASTSGLKRPNSNELGHTDNLNKPTSGYFYDKLSQTSKPIDSGSVTDFEQSSIRPTELIQTNPWPNGYFNDFESDGPLQMTYRPTGLSQTGPLNGYFDSNRPLLNPYRPTVFEHRPASSSYLTFDKKPTFDNNYDDTKVISETNNFDDNNDDILNEFFHRNNKEGATSNDRKTSSNLNINFTPEIIINDKLDFGSDFVKISSVKKHEIFARKGLDSEFKETGIKNKSRGNLKVFKAIEGPIQDMDAPHLPVSIPCCYEVPKPMFEFLMSAVGPTNSTKSTYYKQLPHD